MSENYADLALAELRRKLHDLPASESPLPAREEPQNDDAYHAQQAGMTIDERASLIRHQALEDSHAFLDSEQARKKPE